MNWLQTSSRPILSEIILVINKSDPDLLSPSTLTKRVGVNYHIFCSPSELKRKRQKSDFIIN